MDSPLIKAILANPTVQLGLNNPRCLLGRYFHLGRLVIAILKKNLKVGKFKIIAIMVIKMEHFGFKCRNADKRCRCNGK